MYKVNITTNDVPNRQYDIESVEKTRSVELKNLLNNWLWNLILKFKPTIFALVNGRTENYPFAHRIWFFIRFKNRQREELLIWVDATYLY